MTIKDVRGKEIEIGSFVRYIGTGTVGKILEIKEDDEDNWLKLEDNELWYSSDFLELVDEKSIITSDDDHKDDDTIDKIKNLREDFEDIDVISGGAEGGG